MCFFQIFSGDEHINLRQDAPLYKDKLWGRAISIVYNQILRARIIRHKWRRRLPHYLKEVKEAYEAEQAVSTTSPESDPRGVHLGFDAASEPFDAEGWRTKHCGNSSLATR